MNRFDAFIAVSLLWPTEHRRCVPEVYTDGDGQYDVKELPILVMLLSDDVDFVAGSLCGFCGLCVDRPRSRQA